ncbi:relaxase domain-containing protein, partial [Nocardia neocaledoniensis]|uniref:relaxase domain-containing protein n=1 Tax=Nocardia neocaledoniensis TaxID=236511 RepID=UPI002457C8E5
MRRPVGQRRRPPDDLYHRPRRLSDPRKRKRPADNAEPTGIYFGTRNGVRHAEVEGIVAACFTHRDSRAGDPDLHTHVLVANKVRTLDGK